MKPLTQHTTKLAPRAPPRTECADRYAAACPAKNLKCRLQRLMQTESALQLMLPAMQPRSTSARHGWPPHGGSLYTGGCTTRGAPRRVAPHGALHGQGVVVLFNVDVRYNIDGFHEHFKGTKQQHQPLNQIVLVQRLQCAMTTTNGNLQQRLPAMRWLMT